MPHATIFETLCGTDQSPGYLRSLGGLSLQPVIEYESSTEGDILTLSYKGETPWDENITAHPYPGAILTATLAIGDNTLDAAYWTQRPASIASTTRWIVRSFKLIEDGAGSYGEATLVIHRPRPRVDTVSADELDAETVECEMVAEELSLLRAPLFAPLADPLRPTVTYEDYDELNLPTLLVVREVDALATFHRSEDSPGRRNRIYEAVSTLGKLYCDKVRKTTDAYRASRPVVRRTKRAKSKSDLSSSAINVLQSPPEFADKAAAWLKTADRVVRQGKKGTWEQVEEWMGADTWDTDIYSAG